MTVGILLRVPTTDAGTAVVAGLAGLEASAVEFEALGANAVAGFSMWNLFERCIAGISKGPRISGKNGLNGLEVPGRNASKY